MCIIVLHTFFLALKRGSYLNRLRNSFISYTTIVIKPLNEVITTKDCQYFTSVMEPYNTQFKDLLCECIEFITGGRENADKQQGILDRHI